MIILSNILFIVVIVALIFTWSHRSAIWGGATGGLVIGGIIGLFTGDIFSGVKNGITVGGIIGIIAEILGMISDRLRQEKTLNPKVEPKDQLISEHKYLLKYRKTVEPKVFNALLQEYVDGKVIFQPLRDQLSEIDQDELYSRIDRADFLSSQEKLETIMALMGLFDGSLPKSKKIMNRFEKIFGKKFVQTIEEKQLESNIKSSDLA